MTTANDYFYNTNPKFKKFINKYQLTLINIDIHHTILTDRLSEEFSEVLYCRTYELLNTRNSIVNKAKNIERAFDQYVIPLLNKV